MQRISRKENKKNDSKQFLNNLYDHLSVDFRVYKVHLNATHCQALKHPNTPLYISAWVKVCVVSSAVINCAIKPVEINTSMCWNSLKSIRVVRAIVKISYWINTGAWRAGGVNPSRRSEDEPELCRAVRDSKINAPLCSPLYGGRSQNPGNYCTFTQVYPPANKEATPGLTVD